ncbi:hypothetical protein AA313_de0209048 [Arthrobotrys entomopaga]|nr:hypothetical protein AA313_de0209048 [Arthrobotrys entomopaga]
MIAPKPFNTGYYRFSKPYSLRSILFIVLILGLILHLRTLIFQLISDQTKYIHTALTTPSYSHPIERLFNQNLKRFERLAASQSKTPEQAVKAYKKRYSRDPPPGFTKWVEYALQNNASVIDDYDVIEERIKPFRAFTPADLKARVRSWTQNADSFETLKIRGGKFVEGGEQFNESVADIADRLPDLDILLNWLDEPRIVGDKPQGNEVIAEDFGGKNPWPALTAKCQFSYQMSRHRRAALGYSHTTSPGNKERYVEDVRDMLDICNHPEYQNMHGFLNSPSNSKTTATLVPFLSTLSLATMSDLITPGLDYVDWHYIGDAATVDNTPYAEKKTQLYWKGWSTGSKFEESTWERNHRVRFVRKFNQNPMFNIGFSKYVQCGDFCTRFGELLPTVEIDHPSVGFEYKYAMDLDGNGYSGRYYRLLLSNCLVFKQTLWEQWHDDRLIPWVHYVPVSLSMDELESAVDYFSNDEKGQVIGERISQLGKEWTTKALRAIDMTIYTYRLLLEYAALFQDEGAVIDHDGPIVNY